MTRMLYRRSRKTVFGRVLCLALAIVFTLSFTGVVHGSPESAEKEVESTAVEVAQEQTAPEEPPSEAEAAPEEVEQVEAQEAVSEEAAESDESEAKATPKPDPEVLDEKTPAEDKDKDKEDEPAAAGAVGGNGEAPKWTKTFALHVAGTVLASVQAYRVSFKVDGVAQDLVLTSQGGGHYTADIEVAHKAVVSDWVFYAVVGGEHIALTAKGGSEVIKSDRTNSATFCPGTISGKKYIDVDMDGAAAGDPDDEFGVGWTIAIDGPGLGGGQTVTTDSGGHYILTGLLPGEYCVSEMGQAGFTQIHPEGAVTVMLKAGATYCVNFVNQPIPMVEKVFRLETAATLVPSPDSIEADYTIDGDTFTVVLASLGGGVWESSGVELPQGTVISSWSIHAVVDGERWPVPLFVSTAEETLIPEKGQCVITNVATFAPATIVGSKLIDTDRDGDGDVAPTAEWGPWTFELGDGLAFAVADSAGDFSFGGLLPGTYDVTERMSESQAALFNIVSAGGMTEAASVVGGQTFVVGPFVNQPVPSAIEVVKSATPTTVVPGDTVTYTYTVRNTGPWTLDPVTLTDNLIPGVANTAIPALSPAGMEGDTFTFTVTFTVPADQPVGTLTNVVTAVGEDQFGAEVSDTDTASVEVEAFAPFTEEEPFAPFTEDEEQPFLPFTGGGLLGLLLAAAITSIVGVTLRRLAVQ